MEPLRIVFLVLLALRLAGSQAAAQGGPPPGCLADRAGMVACLAGTLCTCRYDPGGSVAGRPSGFRWDCGALRPSCGVVPPEGPGGGARWGMGELPPIILDPGSRHGAPALESWIR